jgi:hypothetical protein
VSELVDIVLTSTGYEGFLKRTHEKDFDLRWENIRELVNFASQFLPTNDELEASIELDDAPSDET